jgi:alpha-mannosidase
MIENAGLAEQCEGLPEVRQATADAFCDELARRCVGRTLPVWDGELYLEYHRGTYTTQARLKQANRRAEQTLRTAEWLTWAGPAAVDPQTSAQAARQLDEAWKLVLLNQFHDVLPGSSITAVYLESERHHRRIREICAEVVPAGERRWSQQAHTVGFKEPLLVLNPCSSRRSGVVECDGQWYVVADVPALGAAVRERTTRVHLEPARVNDSRLSNGIISATIDNVGRIVSLRRADGGREVCRNGAPMNQLMLYEDRPRGWDAWDVDAEYELKAQPIVEPAESWRIVESGPLRAVVEVTRPLGRASRMTQRLILETGSPRLDIHTRVDWHENHRLARALFPADIRARRATYEIQFGYVERPTHRNSPQEQAMFEVCAHRWADLSEPGCGLALLNDCKYGHSCHDGVLGLSLLRSPKFPDPQADMGLHEFTYSLMAHGGDWRAAGVDREAEALNTPLWALPLPAGQRGTIENDWAPFEIRVDGAAGVVVSAVKRAEDDDCLILRLVETHGGHGQATIAWNLPVKKVETVHLLERPLAIDGFGHNAGERRSTLALRPFQIVALRAEL